ncbi:hypothetical protein J2S98_003812 [Arthrobacter oryzae]|uniref:hypothetical protein n=1 Tax=Arthrobacter oryzae TaxID=409290 RepID=UPI00278AE572|nr:hypothetical protein [Arthrobacter oryzae]MDP9988624.1 hypothetical protein [Arthrobacter oryzae]
MRGPIHLKLPQIESLQPGAVLIGAAAMIMIFKLRWSVLRTHAVSAAAGLALGLLT